MNKQPRYMLNKQDVTVYLTYIKINMKVKSKINS